MYMNTKDSKGQTKKIPENLYGDNHYLRYSNYSIIYRKKQSSKV